MHTAHNAFPAANPGQRLTTDDDAESLDEEAILKEHIRLDTQHLADRRQSCELLDVHYYYTATQSV